MYKIQVALLDTKGNASIKVIDNELETIVDLLGCDHMESLFVNIGGRDFYILFDEEGKINGNQDTITCFLLSDNGNIRDCVLGNVIVVRFDGRDDFTSISKDDFNLIIEWLGDREALGATMYANWRIAPSFLVASRPSKSVMEIVMENYKES